MAANHHLNQCSVIVNYTVKNKSKRKLIQNSNFVVEKNAFENVVCEVVGSLFRPYCVEYHITSDTFTDITCAVAQDSHGYLAICPRQGNGSIHYNDVIMNVMASQITSVAIVCSTVYSGADQRKHQSSGSLAFVRGIQRSPVNSPHKGPVTRKLFPFDDVIMSDVHMRLLFYSCTHLLDRTYREFRCVWLRCRVPFLVSNVGKLMIYSIIYSIFDAQVFAEICLPELHYQFAMYPNAVKPLI